MNRKMGGRANASKTTTPGEKHQPPVTFLKALVAEIRTLDDVTNGAGQRRTPFRRSPIC
jgi:hypothetical protein